MTPAQPSTAGRNPVDIWTGLAVIILTPILLAVLALVIVTDLLIVQPAST